jgi:hypothetical protein
MHYLRRMKIPEQAGKYPGQLSGGQQQGHPLWPQTTSEQKSELSRVCRRLFGFPRAGIRARGRVRLRHSPRAARHRF